MWPMATAAKEEKKSPIDINASYHGNLPARPRTTGRASAAPIDKSRRLEPRSPHPHFLLAETPARLQLPRPPTRSLACLRC
jgi:hypothetical protein